MRQRHKNIFSPKIEKLISQILELKGNSGDSVLIRELMETSLRLMDDDTGRGEIKLLLHALKELRYAFQVFSRYHGVPKVTLFGSARVARNTPEYRLAQEFASKIVKQGYMVITGAAGGIMEAGNRGAGREKSFGINIRLPFEQKANEIIKEDVKLIHFRYFFTRKLIFIKESSAVVLFPGGFGTHDEQFEVLTLIQTGKTNPIPVLLVDDPRRPFWKFWEHYLRKHLLGRGYISPEDLHLFKIVHSAEEAVGIITQFYRHYHSLRYVGEKLVIRLKAPISNGFLGVLNRQFKDIVIKGKIEEVDPFPEERNEPEALSLRRIAFTFDRQSLGRLICLIGELNRHKQPR